jgi:hypothetical protein
MAEIRKFKPGQGNAIAQALTAAMGEPVRPAEPGARVQPTAAKPAEPPAPPAVITFSIKTVAAPSEDEEA